MTVDGPSFDAWTRLMARRTSRRRLVVALAGMGFGVVRARPLPAADPTPTATPAEVVPTGAYPTPLANRFGTCPARGKGGDPDLNVLKNRVDTVAADAWLPVTIGAVLALPEPTGTTRYLRNWPPAATETVGKYLGSPVRVEGFAIGAKRSGGESTNCNGGDYGEDDEVDYHLTLALAGDTFDRALVAEVTPRVRTVHPAWTFDGLGGLVAEETPVRMSGWLLLDTRHSDHVGQVRGTRWEIHPVLRIEVLRDGEWTDLDTVGPLPSPATGGGATAVPTAVPATEADRDCSDFDTQAEAQAFFEEQGGPERDPHGLDRDGDGMVCESLP
jgi:hypothetical protein